MVSFKQAFSRLIAVLSCALMCAAVFNALAQSPAPKPPSKAAGAPGTNATPSDPEDPPGPVSEPKYFDQGLLVRAGETIQPLGPNLMGDLISDYTGALSFSHTDVSLPGNSALSVAVSRRLVTGTKQTALKLGLFGDWDLELPHLRSIALQANPDWYGRSDYNQPYDQRRCSHLALPPNSQYLQGSHYMSLRPDSWWDGHQLVLPGAGSQTLLRRLPTNPIQPTDGASYPVVTKGHWQFSCLPTLARGSGEGFVGRAPDGTSYRFDHMVQRSYPEHKTRPTGGAIGRIEFLILPTLITDRFGNWVRYTYGGTDGMRVVAITSSDGRLLNLTYNGWGNRVQSVSDGTRTWSYTYDGNGALHTVTLPDASQWRFALTSLEREPPLAPDLGCGSAQSYQWDYAEHVGTITHPSGAQGNFTVKMTRHGRTLVPGSEEGCEGAVPPNGVANLVSRYFNNYALVNKTLSGPGLAAQSWRYEYGQALGTFNSTDTPGAGTKTVSTTDPHGHVVKKTFGTGFGITEGLLLADVAFTTSQQALRTTTYRYESPNAGPYQSKLGTTTTPSDVMNTIYTPQKERVITQQDVVMTQTVTGFDEYARPRGRTRSSTLGHLKVESTTYYDDTRLWVLGQLASRTIAGEVVSSTHYDPDTALPKESWRFGKRQASYAFHADGTLASISDGLNHSTSFSNYMRGLPQRITYADATYVTAGVNNIGTVAWVTNEAGTTWHYGYDAMGRLASKTPPGGDGVGYHQTLLRFEQVPHGDKGLEPNHWRQTISTGNAVTVNYFDARWRKRLSTTYDAANRAATESTQRFEYDAYNKTTFASYPARAIDTISTQVPGVRTSYDELGRTTEVLADSELGPLRTKTDYWPALKTRVTNPRGFVTERSFQVFDAPSEDSVVSIALPHGISVTIERDVFGKPLSITRGDTAKSVTRRYVYDSQHRLCKTVEPESGATVQGYDDADNVLWRASGQNFPGPGCETAVSPTQLISFSYDTRNRLAATSYGDGAPGSTRTYTPDGLPQQVITPRFTWSYGYNNRRLLVSEGLTWAGSGDGIGWGVNAYGHVSSITYPDGDTSQYLPNALGQPTRVGSYATDVSYHPSGAVDRFTFGNQIEHQVMPNLRGLPERWRDAGVTQDAYSYDANGNFTAIVDEQQGASTRGMGYDGLDRLISANGIWGAGIYGYDAVDNLTSSTVGGRALTHEVDALSNRLLRLSGSQSVEILYDPNGNVVKRGGQLFDFDIGNRMLRAHGKANYWYDGHGRRAWTEFASGHTQLSLYSQAGKPLRTVHSAQGATKHIYLGDKLIAEVNNLTGISYVHTDALGSPVAKTNGSGQLLSRTRYEPYGATASGTNPTGVGYTGHMNDADTGLVYMQQRYYDPVAGRFLSVDPVTTDADSGAHFGRYHYANNNPYLYTDPDGRAPFGGCSLGGGCEVVYQAGDALDTALTGGQGQMARAAVAEGNYVQAAGHVVAGAAIGVATVAGGAVSAGVKAVGTLAKAAKGLPDSALVCRGGACKAENFLNGSGVTRAGDGTLSGVSTQSRAGASVDELAKPFKNNQVGVTTAGDIRRAGGRVTADGHLGNPNHATVDGLTAQQLERLFSPTRTNPVPPAQRGF